MYESLVWLRIGTCVFCLAVLHFCCQAVFPYSKLISHPVDALQQAFIFLHFMFFLPLVIVFLLSNSRGNHRYLNRVLQKPHQSVQCTFLYLYFSGVSRNIASPFQGIVQLCTVCRKQTTHQVMLPTQLTKSLSSLREKVFSLLFSWYFLCFSMLDASLYLAKGLLRML